MQVLIVGKSPAALAGAVALLEARGHHADATNVFDTVLRDVDPARYDVLVLGGKVPPELKAELAAAFASANPDVRVVHGMAGIPGVIAAQVEEALTSGSGLERPRFEPAARRVVLRLDAARRAEVTLHWGTTFVPPDPGSDSVLLLDAALPAGEYALDLPGHLPEHTVFAEVRLDDVTFALDLAA